MRRFIMSMLLISLLWLMGCSEQREFKGESLNWSVTCSVTAKDKSYEIRYIGQESQSDTTVQYEFKESRNFQNSGESKGSFKNKIISGTSTMNSPYFDEDHFTLHVQWNDKEETIRVVKQ